MDSLIPCEKEKYFRYSGSLTTAPCYESVIWTVFKKPITISQTQVPTINIHLISLID